MSLYENIKAKRDRIENGFGETMRKVGEDGAPTAQNFKDAAKTSKVALNKKMVAKLKSKLAMPDSFDAPNDVRKAAEKGLELRKKFGRGGLSIQEASEQGIGSGVARARDLSKGRVSLDTVKRMKGYFARHSGDSDAKGSDSAGYWGKESNPSAGYIAYLLWGGAAGEKWVNGILKD